MKVKTLIYVLLGLLLVLPASAQNWSTSTRVDVPFEFAVGNVALPAGEYEVVGDFYGKQFKLQNVDHPKYVATVLSQNILLDTYTNQATTKLVFVVDQGRHVLHQICFRGDGHTHDLVHGNEVVELVAHR